MLCCRRSGKRYALADKHSSNGTFVNGRTLPPQQELELSSGDQVQVGQTLLLYTGFSDTAAGRPLRQGRYCRPAGCRE